MEFLPGTYEDENCHKYYTVNYRIIGTLVNSFILIVGILGNVLVVLVVRNDRSDSMQTPTNCYLASLAIADLLALLTTVPNEILTYYIRLDKWLTGLFACKIHYLSYSMGINASALSLVAFTIERYVAICKPMQARTMCTRQRAKKIIVIVWVFTFIYCSPSLILVTLKPLDVLNGTEETNCSLTITDDFTCTWKFSRSFYIYFHLTDLLLFYALPLIITLILYICIARTLYFFQLNSSRQKNSKKQVVKMLAVVVMVFAALWLPYRGLLLFNSIKALYRREIFLHDWYLMFAKSCIYTNCAINPILYNVMSLKFRRAFKRLLCGSNMSPYDRPHNRSINQSSTVTHFSVRLRPTNSISSAKSSKSTLC